MNQKTSDAPAPPTMIARRRAASGQTSAYRVSKYPAPPNHARNAVSVAKLKGDGEPPWTLAPWPACALWAGAPPLLVGPWPTCGGCRWRWRAPVSQETALSENPSKKQTRYTVVHVMARPHNRPSAATRDRRAAALTMAVQG